MAAPSSSVVQLAVCVGGIYVSFLVWALVRPSRSACLRNERADATPSQCQERSASRSSALSPCEGRRRRPETAS